MAALESGDIAKLMADYADDAILILPDGAVVVNTARGAVVDDEALARERLTALIREIGEPYQVVGSAANGAEAKKASDRLPLP